MIGGCYVVLLVANTQSDFFGIQTMCRVNFVAFLLPENTLDMSYYLHFVFDPHQC